VSALFHRERIITTRTKAKAFRPFAEKLITLAKNYNLHNYRRALALLQNEDAVHKLFKVLGPRYADRPGGYTRIIRLGGCRWIKDEEAKWAANRLGDNAERVIWELVDAQIKEKKPKETTEKKK
jgi:large subunit ribosomal protein L17